MAEMCLDRFRGDEQGVCDLRRAALLSGHVRDAGLGGCERVSAAKSVPARTGSGRKQFVVGFRRKHATPTSVGEIQPFA